MTRSKRGANTGSISHKPRPDGRYEARLILPDGRRRSFYGKTWSEAEAKLNEAREQIRSGQLPSPGRMTVDQLAQSWLESCEERLARSTYLGYDSRYRTYVLPTIGNVKLSTISAAHVQRVMTYARKLNRARTTRRSLYITMRSMFAHAVKWGYLASNPANGVKPPKAEERDLRITSEADIRRLVDAIADSDYKAPLTLAFPLGLRFGEIRALRWRDVDFESGRIHIRHGVDLIKGEVVFTPLKTRSSRRTLPMPESVRLTLRTHRAAQNETRLKLGEAWQDFDLVCPRANGRPMHNFTLNSALARCCAGAGLPRVSMHDLRHLSTVALVMQNVSPKIIMAILGHADARTAIEIYDHVRTEALAAAADSMDHYFTLRKSS